MAKKPNDLGLYRVTPGGAVFYERQPAAPCSPDRPHWLNASQQRLQEEAAATLLLDVLGSEEKARKLSMPFVWIWMHDWQAGEDFTITRLAVEAWIEQWKAYGGGGVW